jgi:hypothetical protein
MHVQCGRHDNAIHCLQGSGLIALNNKETINISTVDHNIDVTCMHREMNFDDIQGSRTALACSQVNKSHRSPLSSNEIEDIRTRSILTLKLLGTIQSSRDQPQPRCRSDIPPSERLTMLQLRCGSTQAKTRRYRADDRSIFSSYMFMTRSGFISQLPIPLSISLQIHDPSRRLFKKTIHFVSAHRDHQPDQTPLEKQTPPPFTSLSLAEEAKFCYSVQSSPGKYGIPAGSGTMSCSHNGGVKTSNLLHTPKSGNFPLPLSKLTSSVSTILPFFTLSS